MMSLHKAIGSDPLTAFLLWPEAGVSRPAAAPKLRRLCCQDGRPGPAMAMFFPVSTFWRAVSDMGVSITQHFPGFWKCRGRISFGF